MASDPTPPQRVSSSWARATEAIVDDPTALKSWLRALIIVGSANRVLVGRLLTQTLLVLVLVSALSVGLLWIISSNQWLGQLWRAQVLSRLQIEEYLSTKENIEKLRLAEYFSEKDILKQVGIEGYLANTIANDMRKPHDRPASVLWRALTKHANAILGDGSLDLKTKLYDLRDNDTEFTKEFDKAVIDTITREYASIETLRSMFSLVFNDNSVSPFHGKFDHPILLYVYAPPQDNDDLKVGLFCDFVMDGNPRRNSLPRFYTVSAEGAPILNETALNWTGNHATLRKRLRLPRGDTAPHHRGGHIYQMAIHLSIKDVIPMENPPLLVSYCFVAIEGLTIAELFDR